MYAAIILIHSLYLRNRRIIKGPVEHACMPAQSGGVLESGSVHRVQKRNNAGVQFYFMPTT